MKTIRPVILTAIVALWAGPPADGKEKTAKVVDKDGKTWSIVISPRTTSAVETTSNRDKDKRKNKKRRKRRAPQETARHRHYQAVYESIPFSRAEYDANPSYRHEATMEFLFGKLRPQVIHRHRPPASGRDDNMVRYRYRPGRFYLFYHRPWSYR